MSKSITARNRAEERNPKPAILQEQYLTPEECADVLRLSRRELYRRLARGDILHIVLPNSRRILIPESALAAVLEAGRVGGGRVA